MATEDADGPATVADRPSAKLAQPSEASSVVAKDAQATLLDKPESSAGGAHPAPAATPTIAGTSGASERSLTTAADALHDEEVERTRLFIRMG